MKKLIAILLITLGLSALTENIYAQGGGQKAYLVRNPSVTTGGKFNSSTIAGGSATVSTVQARDWSVFPLYTKLDTVNNTGADTFYQRIADYNSVVYVWAHVNSISGTNTSCTVKVQVTGDAVTGTGYTGDWTTVKTFTVSSTGNPYAYIVNSELGIAGWHGTNLRVIFTGVGTHSSSVYCGLNIK